MRRSISFLALAPFLAGCAAESPEPLTGGLVERRVTADGLATIGGRSTGDACGPPPANIEQRTTVEIDTKVLSYVKAGGKVDTLSGIKQDLAGADLGCDAVMYRTCKICFATQSGQGCAVLTANALTYCQRRTGVAAEGTPAFTLAAATAAAPAPRAPAPSVPVVVGDSPVIQRLIVSLWTDTDDKDRDESVSVRILVGQDIIGTGGPWGYGEKWGDQENRNNGLPHEFGVRLTRAVLLRDVDALRVEIIKSQAGGNGGNGWHFRGAVLAETANGRTEVWRSRSTIKLGNGHAATFATGL
jgi:hypothetical protein